MSVIFKGVEMPTACCFVDGEHSAFAHFEYCKFYNICEKRDTIKTNCKPSDCPVKALEQEPKIGQWIAQNDDYFDWYECSECGYGSEGEMQYSSEYDVRTNYCPCCGAKMEEVEE